MQVLVYPDKVSTMGTGVHNQSALRGVCVCVGVASACTYNPVWESPLVLLPCFSPGEQCPSCCGERAHM